MINTREKLYALNFISVLSQGLDNYLRGKAVFFKIRANRKNGLGWSICETFVQHKVK